MEFLSKEGLTYFWSKLKARLDNLSSATNTNTSEIAVQKSRIDSIATLPSGSTTADAELIDIRVKADGTTASSAGNAVREQVGDLKSAFANINNITGDINLFPWELNKLIDRYGAVSNDTGRAVSNFVQCVYGQSITYKSETDHTNISGIYFYDINKNPISGWRNNSSASQDYTATVSVPKNARYFRLSTHLGKVAPDNAFAKSSPAFIDYFLAKDSNIENQIVNGTLIDISEMPELWSTGTITSTGAITTDHGSDNTYTTTIFDFPVYYSIGISQSIFIAKYKNGAFVARSEVTGGKIIPDDTFDSYRMMIIYSNAAATGTRTPEEVLNDVEYIVNSFGYKQIEEAEFLENQFYSMTGGKICHYSVDDVYNVLADLIQNADTYTSIFDNNTLAELLSIHNDTGLCITLNAFNTANGFNIANVPEKATFKSEFQANKDWLKFAFHGEDSTSNYDSSTGISSSYDTFVSAIYKLTGTYECIDSFTRLGFFGGNKENILILKNKTHGITGLLCADSTSRNSYYLNSRQNAIVQRKGIVFDTENKIIFIKTITRGNSIDMQNEIELNPLYQKYVECFSHESDTGWLTTCRSVAIWLAGKGYTFAFPSVLFA